jgi:hypothetical protein
MKKNLNISKLEHRSDFRFWCCTPLEITKCGYLLMLLRDCCETVAKTKHGLVEKLVNSLDLGSSAERLVGSSPTQPTKLLGICFNNLNVMLWRVKRVCGMETKQDLGTSSVTLVLGSCLISLHTCI